MELLMIQQTHKLQMENKQKLTEDKLHEADFLNALLTKNLPLHNTNASEPPEKKYGWLRVVQPVYGESDVLL